MGEAPDVREQEDCPSSDVCAGLCDQHDPRAAQTAQSGATEPATGQTAPEGADGLNGRETGGGRRV